MNNRDQMIQIALTLTINAENQHEILILEVSFLVRKRRGIRGMDQVRIFDRQIKTGLLHPDMSSKSFNLDLTGKNGKYLVPSGRGYFRVLIVWNPAGRIFIQR